ncbi:single-stranded DNA-binding protein [soil metagenome]
MAQSALLEAAQNLIRSLAGLEFSPPVTHVYNPLEYAWEAHAQYLGRFGQGRKRVVFLGMNPGPYGMAQTGVPFGEIPSVRDWMGISAAVESPANEHPKRRVAGFECRRSEVSGRRLWGLFADRFGPADAFFADHFVANFCPLVFMEETGRNRTPDKIPADEMAPVLGACDAHLRAVVAALEPRWVIGVGAFAEKRLRLALGGDSPVQIGTILHPSPASPAANRGWAGAATRQLTDLGVW